MTHERRIVLAILNELGTKEVSNERYEKLLLIAGVALRNGLSEEQIEAFYQWDKELSNQ